MIPDRVMTIGGKEVTVCSGPEGAFKEWLASLSTGRTKDDLNKLDDLAKEVVQNQKNENVDIDAWAERIAESLATYDD